MANQGFDYGQIYNRLFDPFSLRLKKYEEVIEYEPLYFYHRAFEAVMYYNHFNDEGYAWSDCVCWVYTDLYDFEHYEKVIYPTIKENTHLFDRLVFTDVHVGMDVANSGYSLYDLKWDKEELFKRLDIMVEHTVEHQKSNTLIINDLGDFLDGYNGQTTRGGHKLPQNMSTNDAFDTALHFKIKLVKSLAPYFDKIKFINICNDNHAGSFGYIVNSAFKIYIEEAINNVEVINQRKFIDYYIIENRCFCLTHGKDDVNMKFGFKPKADPATVNKVLGYLNQIEVLNKGYFEIEFGKGDSHLAVLDDSSSDIFNYYSYPAFSPSSNWVQLNFNKGRSGFVHFNYMENRKNINPYFFN
jgi:hypothetical protein